MANSKEGTVHDHVEIIENPNTYGLPSVGGTAAEIYHGDGAVLLDVGAKDIEGSANSTLKLARDGHVC